MHSTAEPAVLPFISAPRHPVEIIHRLRRGERWLQELRRSYQDGYACIDVLDQLIDLRQELDQVVRLVVEDHAGSCLEPVIHASAQEAGACRLLLAISRTDGAAHRGLTTVASG